MVYVLDLQQVIRLAKFAVVNDAEGYLQRCFMTTDDIVEFTIRAITDTSLDDAIYDVMDKWQINTLSNNAYADSEIALEKLACLIFDKTAAYLTLDLDPLSITSVKRTKRNNLILVEVEDEFRPDHHKP